MAEAIWEVIFVAPDLAAVLLLFVYSFTLVGDLLRAKAFPLKNSILFSVFSVVSCILYAMCAWAVSWLLTWLAKLMLICVKPSDGVIMAILNCRNFFMMRIWNYLEVCCIAPTVFTSYFHHWSLCQWNSTLLIALLLSPTAIITSTIIHSFYDVYFMGHINWLCCCCCFYSLIHVFLFLFLLEFFLDNKSNLNLHHIYYDLSKASAYLHCTSIVLCCVLSDAKLRK